jgi:signal peptidase I
MSIKGINDGIKKLGIMDRVFTTVSGEGQPQSYFKYFLFALAVFLLENIFGKRKAKNS